VALKVHIPVKFKLKDFVKFWIDYIGEVDRQFLGKLEIHEIANNIIVILLLVFILTKSVFITEDIVCFILSYHGIDSG
jgi:hypothetical protein